MERMRQVLGQLDGWLAGLVLFTSLFIVTLEMTGRSAFSVSFLWSEELSRYLLVWTTYLGASAALGERAHIRVLFVVARLPYRARQVVEGLGLALCLVFTVTLTWAGVRLVQDSRFFGMMSPDSALPVPIWMFQLIVPVGFALMSLRLVVLLALLVRGRLPPPSEAMAGGED